jgi:hypothetical protein
MRAVQPGQPGQRRPVTRAARLMRLALPMCDQDAARSLMLRPPPHWGVPTQPRHVLLPECRTIAAVLRPPQRLIWTAVSAQATKLMAAVVVMMVVVVTQAAAMPSARRLVRAAPDP